MGQIIDNKLIEGAAGDTRGGGGGRLRSVPLSGSECRSFVDRTRSAQPFFPS